MTTKKNSISIIGAGYVGYSLAILLAKKNKVKILDIDRSKVASINNYKSPIEDTFINEFSYKYYKELYEMDIISKDKSNKLIKRHKNRKFYKKINNKNKFIFILCLNRICNKYQIISFENHRLLLQEFYFLKKILKF